MAEIVLPTEADNRDTWGGLLNTALLELDARTKALQLQAREFVPGDHGYSTWAFDPATIVATSIPTAGTLNLTRLKWRRGETLTNLYAHVAVAAAGLTSGQCFAAAFDTSRNLLGVTATQHTAWQVSGTKTMALVAPVANLQQDAILVGLWWQGTTGPTLSRGANSSGVNASLATAASRFATADTGLTTTAPSTAATLVSSTFSYWMAAG